MPTPGRFREMLYGSGINQMGIITGAGTVTLTSANAGACFRFMALGTEDILSVRVSWSNFTVGTGVMSMGIYTIDATTGKPQCNVADLTANLYDANARTASITPVANSITTYTFSSAPTTGLTAGTEYGLCFVTTSAFTACQLNVLSNPANLTTHPGSVYTTADGSTWTESLLLTPLASFVIEGSIEEPFNFFPYQKSASTDQVPIYTTYAGGSKISVYHTIKVAGVCAYVRKDGTPAGNLRVRVMDSSDNVITGTTVTLDKDSILGTVQLRKFYFPGIVTLNPGTYRIVFDSADSANSSNAWGIKYAIPLNAAVTVNSCSKSTSTTDVTAGPITWSDDATGIHPSAQFILDDIITHYPLAV